jgi:hypothetical protein
MSRRLRLAIRRARDAPRRLRTAIRGVRAAPRRFRSVIRSVRAPSRRVSPSQGDACGARRRVRGMGLDAHQYVLEIRAGSRPRAPRSMLWSRNVSGAQDDGRVWTARTPKYARGLEEPACEVGTVASSVLQGLRGGAPSSGAGLPPRPSAALPQGDPASRSPRLSPHLALVISFNLPVLLRGVRLLCPSISLAPGVPGVLAVFFPAAVNPTAPSPPRPNRSKPLRRGTRAPRSARSRSPLPAGASRSGRRNARARRQGRRGLRR